MKSLQASKKTAGALEWDSDSRAPQHCASVSYLCAVRVQAPPLYQAPVHQLFNSPERARGLGLCRVTVA